MEEGGGGVDGEEVVVMATKGTAESGNTSQGKGRGLLPSITRRKRMEGMKMGQTISRTHPLDYLSKQLNPHLHVHVERLYFVP